MPISLDQHRLHTRERRQRAPADAEPSTMTSAQYRMARAALGWTARQVANSVDMPKGMSASLLRGDTFPSAITARLRRAFEAEGIVFLEDDGDGPGVRFKDAEEPRSTQ